MEQLSPKILVIACIWAVIAIALYIGSRRFPKFTYEELLRNPPLSKPPPRQWYHSIPVPMLWIALCVAGSTIAGIVYTRNHPTVFPQLLQSLSIVLLWLNDVDTNSFFIVPLSKIWAAIMIMGLMNAFSALSSLFTTEITARLFPDYLEYRFGTALGRMGKRFDKDWETEYGKQKNRTESYLAFLIIVLMVVAYIGIEVNDEITMYLALACAFIVFVYYFRLRRPDSKMRPIEIRKRFDSAKLTLLQRKIFWRSGLRAWIILPLGVAWFGYVIPFYTFDQDGIREHRRREETLLPWTQVTSLDIALLEALPDTSKDKEPHIPEPRLEMIFQTSEKKIDLNEMDALGVDPRLTQRLIEFVRRKNIHIACTIEPIAQEQLRKFFTESKASNVQSEKETLTIIQEICLSSS